MIPELPKRDPIVPRWLARVVDLYLEFTAEMEEAFEKDPECGDRFVDGIDLRRDLAIAIWSARRASCVGDLASCEIDDLREDGLIWRDASDTYDEYIEDYFDVVIDQKLGHLPAFSSIPSQLDGLQLCQWIDHMFPIDAPQGGKLIVLH